MRILYGAHTQGQGGLAKAAVLVPLMESLGHEVCVLTSGRRAPAGYSFRYYRHLPGLEYVVSRGQTDYLQTFLRWGRELPTIVGALWQVKRLCRTFRPDLVISDFEPLTAHPLLKPGCEVLAVSRPAALIDPGVPVPGEERFDRRMVSMAIRLFAAGADRRFGYHLEPATYRCLPPVLRSDVDRVTPTNGRHLLVYNVYHAGEGRAAELVAWADRNDCPVAAYGFPEVRRRERVGKVEFRPSGREHFLRDLASCRALITTAGLSLPVEAYRLGKPACVVPIPRQWEQEANAFHLEQAGLSRWLPTWDYSAALDTPPPGSAALDWLTTDPMTVLRRLLPRDEVQVRTSRRVAA